MILFSFLAPKVSNAALITFGTAYTTSSFYVGINTTSYAKTHAETIFYSSEIGSAGNITSYALNKASGTTSTIDSVYIFMKESAATAVGTTVSLAGYTLVYAGDFPNASASGWMTATLSSPFAYTGTGNLHVLVVRHGSSTISSGPNYYVSYSSSGGYSTGYRYVASTTYWTGWAAPTATAPNYTYNYYRAHAQINLNAFASCTSTPTAGTAVASTTTSCPGAPVKFSLTGSTLASSITYDWDTSSTGVGGWALAGSSTLTTGIWNFTPPSGRTLYYRCRSTCTAGGSTVTSTTVSVAVSSALNVPYTETFEGVTPGVNPTCATASPAFSTSTYYYGYDYWKVINDASSIYAASNHTPSGANYLVASINIGVYSPYGLAADYWFTPGINLVAGKTYRFSYWHRMGDYAASTYGGQFDHGMYYANAPSKSASVLTAIKPDIIGTTNNSYVENAGDFSVPTSGIYNLAIKANNRSFGGYYCSGSFDDIKLVELPACNTATASTLGSGGKALASPNVMCSTPSTTTLSVSSSPAFSGLSFLWEVASGTPTTFSATSITTASGAYTISTGGTYYFRCKVSCAATGLSTYSDTVKVTTTPITPPYTEDFEGGTTGVNLPCASYSSSWGSGSYWYLQGSPYASYCPGIKNHTTGGSKYLHAGYYLGVGTGAGDEFWFTPGLALTASKAYDVSFWYSNSGYDSYYASVGTSIGVRAGTSQTKAAMTIMAGSDSTVYNNATMSATYGKFTRGFIAPTTGTYYVGIKVNNYGYSYYGMAIDDIGVNQLPPCSAKPSAGTAVASPALICSSGTTTLTLSGLSLASDLTFQWQTSSTGLAGSWTDISGATAANYVSGVLTSGPIYYRCYVKCGLVSAPNTDTSIATKVNVGAITPPYFEDFEAASPGVNIPCASYTFSWSSGSYWYLQGSPYASYCPGIKNHTPGGSKYLHAGYYLGYGTSGAAQYWFTPALALTAAKAYNVSYWYSNSGYYPSSYGTYATDMGIYAGTSQSAAAMTIAAGADTTIYVNAVGTPTYGQYTRGFIAPTTGNYYVGIKVNHKNYCYYGFAIDDIGIDQIPPCSAKPVAGAAVAYPSLICTSGTSSISLLGISLASDLSFQWQTSTTSATSGFTDIAGANLPAYTTPTLSVGPVWYRCIVICNAIGAPNTDTSVAAKVSVGALDIPYTEDFETGITGVNMPCASQAGTWNATSLLYWSLRSGDYSASYPGIKNHTPGGKNYIYSGYYNGPYYTTTDQYFWFTPALKMTAGKGYKVGFWFNGAGYSTGYNGLKIGIYAGTAQNAAGMIIRAGGLDSVVKAEVNGYAQMVRSFVAPTTGNYYVGIKTVHTGYNYPGIPIDDINIEQLPDCSGKPVAGAPDAFPYQLCTSGTTRLRLSGTSVASGIQYQWQESSTGPTTGFANSTTGTGFNTGSYLTASISATRWYRCIVTCSVTGLSDTSSTVTVNVGAITPPYREDFEKAIVGVNVPCAAVNGTWATASTYLYWTIKGAPLSSAYPTKNITPGGSQYLYGGYYAGTYYSSTVPYFWMSPAIKLTAGNTYEFSYWYLGSGYSGGSTNLGMYMGTTQTAAGMTTALRPDLVGVNTGVPKQLIARFVAPSTANYYMGIKVNHTTYTYSGIAIDDIGLDQLPNCTGAPTAGTVSTIPTLLCSPGVVALDMDLAGVSKVGGLTYQWYSTTTPCPSVGTPISGVQTSPAFTSGTISGTTYFYCVVKCSLTGDSTISSCVKVDVGAVTPPYIETFETVTPGVNAPCASYTYSWGASAYWYTYGSPFSTSYSAIDNHTPGGSRYLFAGYYLGTYYSGAPQYWFTPAIKFTAGKLYQFSFWYNGSAYGGGKTDLAAFYGTAQSAAAMTTAIGTSLSGVNTATYKQFKSQFTPSIGGNLYIGIQVSHTTYSYPGVVIDDIGLQEVPPCSAPVVAGTITADPGRVCIVGGTTVLDLEGSTLATGLVYNWEYRTATSAWTTVSASAPPYTTDPLVGKTWFRCTVKCAATGAQAVTPEFIVNVGGYDVPYKEDFEGVDVGAKPVCSDATYWGLYDYDGFKVKADPTYAYAYNNTPGGKKYLAVGYYLGYYGYYSPLTDDNFWFTPGINLSTKYKYKFNYYYVGSSNSVVAVSSFYGKSQSVGGMTISLQKPTNLTGSYVQFDTTIRPPSNGTFYFGLKKTNVTLGSYFYTNVGFDDINVNYAPCDGLPFAGEIISNVSSGTPKCVGTPVTLTDTGSTINLVPGISYQWQRKPIGGAGPFVWSDVVGATDSILKADTLVGYEYRFAVTCNNVSMTAYSPVFQVPAHPPHPAVSINPTITPIVYCLGDSIKFNATNFPSAVYDWMKDSVEVPGWKFSDFGATEPGSYYVKVTSPISPCPAYSNIVKLVVNDPGYTVSITTPADSIICAGTSMLLSATSSKPGVTYQWRRNNIDIPGATSSSYLVTTGGSYRVMAHDGTSVCKAASRNIMITVKPNPPAVINIPGGTATACENEGVLLQANTGGFSYEWRRTGSTIVGWTDSVQLVKNSGIYSVKVRSKDGCVSVSSNVTVNILPSPIPVISKTGLTLSATTTYVSYEWYRNGKPMTPAETKPTLNLTMQGYYKVRVKDANGCEGESNPIEINDQGLSIGTTATISDNIRIYPNPTQNMVSIDAPIAVVVTVKDVTGRTIINAKETKTIDLSKFADGVYLFMISDKEGNELIRQQRVNKITSE